jgi:hypothetical protein
MPADQNEIPAFTRLILDSLWSLHAELIESGQGWSSELLDQVEDQVYERLSAGIQGHQSLFFDLVFRRAFAEAKEICLAMTAFVEADGEIVPDNGLTAY